MLLLIDFFIVAFCCCCRHQNRRRKKGINLGFGPVANVNYSNQYYMLTYVFRVEDIALLSLLVLAEDSLQ
jgi:hypothetical protein